MAARQDQKTGSKVTYPRVCECGYSANNPAMWSYHQKTHKPIPDGTLCHHGCGQPAQYCGTGGIYTCDRISQHCPEYINRHRTRIKEQWSANDWTERRTKTGLIMKNMSPEDKEKFFAKISDTKYKKMLAQPMTADRKKYIRQIHQLSQYHLRMFPTIVNPEKHQIGLTDYHLDHIVSKHIGWLLQIPAEYIASTHNLRVVSYTDNTHKSIGCGVHPIDLLQICNAPQELITKVELAISQLSDSLVQRLPARMQNYDYV
jgi:hypothetical protein